jgi:hypothetical protein
MIILPRHCKALSILFAGAALTTGIPLSTQAQAQSQAVNAEVQTESLTTLMTRNVEKTKGDFNENNNKIWSKLLNACSPPSATSVNDSCATEAVYAALGECEASARYFKKDNKGWQIVSLVLTLASAASTAVGASTTVFEPKIWSTLGGATGLLSGRTTLNGYASGDLTGLGAINSTINTLNTTVQGQSGSNTGSNTGANAKPDPLTLFRSARAYGAACASAANGSPTTTATPQSGKTGGKGGSS